MKNHIPNAPTEFMRKCVDENRSSRRVFVHWRARGKSEETAYILAYYAYNDVSGEYNSAKSKFCVV